MSRHQAVEKAIDILLAFTPLNQEMGTLEVSEKVGIHISTASRILHALTEKRLLQRHPKTKKFQLGPSSMAISMAIRKSLETNLIHIAKPFMDDLRDNIGETIALEIFSGVNTVLAYLAYGPHRTNLAGSIGDILAVHAAAGAKAILAFSSREVRSRVLKGTLVRLTPNTITDCALLQKQFQKIRQRSISLDREEHDIGTNAMGTPIFNVEGKPVAGLVVAGPSQRIKLKVDSPVALQLKETATKISEQLYYKPL
ncbi:IclR family transcriptional regulator [Thermodesulfobacteriota bacterium]